MIGSIAGDIIGSRFETQTLIDKPDSLFSFNCGFTDDTLCTIAVAQSLLKKEDLHSVFQKWVKIYPTLEYGGKFRHWALSHNPEPYGSFGNGGAMRVSPVGLLFNSLEQVTQIANTVTAVSHNHDDSLRASILLAQCIFLAKNGKTKADIRQLISDSSFSVFSIQSYRAKKLFSTSAIDTIGPAFASALNADSFEEAMFNCIEIGGDTDTICCMCGGLAEALFGIPPEICAMTLPYLDDEMKQVVSDLYTQSGYESIGIPVRNKYVQPTEEVKRSFFNRFFWG